MVIQLGLVNDLVAAKVALAWIRGLWGLLPEALLALLGWGMLGDIDIRWAWLQTQS